MINLSLCLSMSELNTGYEQGWSMALIIRNQEVKLKIEKIKLVGSMWNG